VNWFGESWGAPVCDPDTHIDTPTGTCDWCSERIATDDAGVSLPYAMQVIHYHLNCWLRQVFGSVGHQDGKCSCTGDHMAISEASESDDPPGMTLREAANAAVEAFYKKVCDG
jgi:hypothetical protein